MVPKYKTLEMFAAGMLISHGNAQPHITKTVNTVIEKYGWETLPHPS